MAASFAFVPAATSSILDNQFLGAQRTIGASSFFGTQTCPGSRTIEADETSYGGIMMAVPKKHKSKQKTRSAKAVWKRKAAIAAEKAISLYKSIATGKSSFVYELPDILGDVKKNDPEDPETPAN